FPIYLGLRLKPPGWVLSLTNYSQLKDHVKNISAHTKDSGGKTVKREYVCPTHITHYPFPYFLYLGSSSHFFEFIHLGLISAPGTLTLIM
ncbi:MAG: hypothetical protein AAGA62_09155, partial [Bacteroidota bacterium]